ncbi:MAG TPA: immunoglobulin-like domain-containing protein [Longimicrobiaceae bacterium]
MRTMLAMCTVLTLAACGQGMQAGEASDITLSVEPTSAAPGDSVELVLRNNSSSDVGYNLCSSGLERRVESGWEQVPSDRLCTMELRTLPPGDEARYTLQLPADLAPGEYQAITNAGPVDGGGGPIRSGSFQVTP